MKKQIIALSICCSCLLNASWIDDAKLKASGVVDNVKSKVTEYSDEKEKQKQVKINKCITDIEKNLPDYAIFLEQNYISSTKPIETKVLSNYKKLTLNGISNELQSSLDVDVVNKLANSTSNIEYMSTVLSELKKIQKQLKKNDKTKIDNLVKQTQFLMYAWTTPMEILSSQKIYDTSLLGISNQFYKNTNKDTYKNYNELIYSMLYINLMNENIVIPKDTTASALLKNNLYNGVPTTEAKKGLKNICTEITTRLINTDTADDYIQSNFANNLNIEKDKLANDIKGIKNNKDLFESAVFLNKNIN
jgi:hypothetical protein